jgi:hypothetical protein
MGIKCCISFGEWGAVADVLNLLIMSSGTHFYVSRYMIRISDIGGRASFIAS